MEFMLVKFNQNMFLFFKNQLLIPKHGWHKCVSNYQSSPRLQESSSQRAMPKFPLKSPWLPRKLATRKCQRLNQIEISLIHSWFLVLLKIGPQSPVSIFDVRWNSIDCLVAKFPLLNVVTVYWITLMLSILAFPALKSHTSTAFLRFSKESESLFLSLLRLPPFHISPTYVRLNSPPYSRNPKCIQVDS